MEFFLGRKPKNYAMHKNKTMAKKIMRDFTKKIFIVALRKCLMMLKFYEVRKSDQIIIQVMEKTSGMLKGDFLVWCIIC